VYSPETQERLHELLSNLLHWFCGIAGSLLSLERNSRLDQTLIVSRKFSTALEQEIGVLSKLKRAGPDNLTDSYFSFYVFYGEDSSEDKREIMRALRQEIFDWFRQNKPDVLDEEWEGIKIRRFIEETVWLTIEHLTKLDNMLDYIAAKEWDSFGARYNTKKFEELMKILQGLRYNEPYLMSKLGWYKDRFEELKNEDIESELKESQEKGALLKVKIMKVMRDTKTDNNQR